MTIAALLDCCRDGRLASFRRVIDDSCIARHRVHRRPANTDNTFELLFNAARAEARKQVFNFKSAGCHGSILPLSARPL